MSRIVSHLRIAAIAVLVLFALLSATAFAKSTHKLKRSPDTFVKGPQKKGPMGRKEAGKTIPMTGGTLSLGAFYVEVSVGTGAGAATFDAIVDTGSSNTAVPAAGCSACVESSGYNFTASPTGQPVTADSAACQNCRPTELGQGVVTKAEDQWCPYGHGAAYSKNNSQCGFSVSYGGSSSGIAGFVSQDVVCLGGATSATGSCSKSAFIGSIEEEYPMGTINSGIVGLAYPANACNPTCQPTLLDSLVASGTLAADENKFGMCLTKTTGGILDLGYFNETRAKGELQWTDIVVEHWYNINCTNMLVGGVDTGVPSFLFDVRNDAIGTFVDSGTSILLMSPFAFGQLTQTVLGLPQYASLDGASVLFGGGANACYTFANVSVISQYPLVEFVLAGSKGGEDFKIGIDAANYLTPNPEIPGEFCLAIQGVASLGVIFGDVIMQRYYIAFDRVGRRLGFAPIANCEM